MPPAFDPSKISFELKPRVAAIEASQPDEEENDGVAYGERVSKECLRPVLDSWAAFKVFASRTVEAACEEYGVAAGNSTSETVSTLVTPRLLQSKELKDYRSCLSVARGELEARWSNVIRNALVDGQCEEADAGEMREKVKTALDEWVVSVEFSLWMLVARPGSYLGYIGTADRTLKEAMGDRAEWADHHQAIYAFDGIAHYLPKYDYEEKQPEAHPNEWGGPKEPLWQRLEKSPSDTLFWATASWATFKVGVVGLFDNDRYKYVTRRNGVTRTAQDFTYDILVAGGLFEYLVDIAEARGKLLAHAGIVIPEMVPGTSRHLGATGERGWFELVGEQIGSTTKAVAISEWYELRACRLCEFAAYPDLVISTAWFQDSDRIFAESDERLLDILGAA